MTILFTKFPLQSHWGGGEKHTVQLAEALTAKGHTCIFFGSDPILLREWKKRNYPSYSHWAGPEPTSLGGLLRFTMRLPLTWWQFGKWTKRLTQAHKIDCVYAQSLTEKLLLTPWLLKQKLPMYWMEHLQIEGWLLKNPYRPQYVKLSKRVTVVTVSQGVGDQLVDLGVPKQNVKVIYNGIDVNDFKPREQKKSPILRLGTAARLSVEKDIATVLQAIALVDQKVEYTIAGTGGEEETLKALTKELGLEKQVKFLGFTSDVKAFLESIDVFVLPSFRRESFGIAVAEAMAMGKPAIVTDIPGLREVVKDKETGFVVETNQPEAVAKAITFYIDNPEAVAAMGQAARKRIIENFSLDKMIAEFTTLFEG